jgi:hypothetical protein
MEADLNDAGGAAAESSGLHGSEYIRNSRTAATRDDDVSGRWVAIDESGWDGEQLYGRHDRYVVIGSVAIDDELATQIVDGLRRDTGLAQPPELKFRQFTSSKGSDRLAALTDLFRPGGVLSDRCSVFMVDKHYFVAGKIIDLLLETRAFNLKFNLYAGGLARELARTLFDEGARALGHDGLNRLIATMVNFASRRNHDGSQVTVDALFDEIEQAWVRSHRRRVTKILFDLRETRSEAASHLQALGNSDLPTMEPLIPCLNSVVGSWSALLGGVSAIVDEQKILTDTRLDQIRAAASWRPGPFGRFARVPDEQAVRAMVRGVSSHHPSIQLADLVAGAGQAVARRHMGAQSPAGEDLWPVIVPLISDRSMVPHDEPRRFSLVSG